MRSKKLPVGHEEDRKASRRYGRPNPNTSYLDIVHGYRQAL